MEPELPELIDYRKLGKKFCEVLCVLSIHANYVSIKMNGVVPRGY